MTDFYDKLPRETEFDRLTEDTRYHRLPHDWLIGVSDVVGSTAHVATGHYKSVNMVGAAIVSAVMNGLGNHAFPFVFGGDGASFAVRPDAQTAVTSALSAVARWSQTEFGIEMRVALVPLTAIREAGYDVRVARFQVSDGADYAMFNGGGLSWAEAQMKQGAYWIEPAPVGTVPDLTGLSCRWANMPSRNGTILSLVVSAVPYADPDGVQRVFKDVIAVASTLERGGHPAPATGMEVRRAPRSAELEAHVTRGTGALGPARRKAAFEALIYWALHRTGIKLAGFDARHYARVVAANADFRKLDDGLKMTLDCDSETRSKLDAILSQAEADGIIRYGMSTQDEAMMTCIVPSVLSDDHLHFIDGAAGGYTQAAKAMKES